LKLLGEGDVFIAQAVLEGLFWVTGTGSCELTVEAPYELKQALTSSLNRAAFSDVTASLALYDFLVTDNKTGNSMLLTESTVAPPVYEQKSFFKKTNTYTPKGTLSFTYTLQPPTGFDLTGLPLDNFYDFEASASTVAGAGLPIFRGFPFWWWHRFLVK
jgi:hypothetical protein